MTSMDPGLDAHDLVRRLFDEAVNAGRLEVIAAVYTPDFVDHAPGPGQAPGPAGIAEVVARYRAAIPDLHVEVEDVVAEGDRIATRETWTGTHRHDLPGAPATGRAFRLTRMHVFRVVDGRIAEEWTAGSVFEVLREPPDWMASAAPPA